MITVEMLQWFTLTMNALTIVMLIVTIAILVRSILSLRRK